MRPQSSGRLELILTVVSVALVAVVTASGLAFGELVRQPVAAQKPGLTGPIQVLQASPAPADDLDPAVEVPERCVFMPDDYREFHDLGELLQYGCGRLQLSDVCPGPDFMFVGKFKDAQRETFVWYEGDFAQAVRLNLSLNLRFVQRCAVIDPGMCPGDFRQPYGGIDPNLDFQAFESRELKLLQRAVEEK